MTYSGRQPQLNFQFSSLIFFLILFRIKLYYTENQPPSFSVGRVVGWGGWPGGGPAGEIGIKGNSAQELAFSNFKS